ncbi:MAG: inositol monophosphatase family protein [Phycisphaerae bacterium]
MSDSAYPRMLDLATRLAEDAARVSVPQMGRTPVTRKHDASVVTAVDRAIQHQIFLAVREAYPDHALLGEEELAAHESVPAEPGARFCWVIDPLDGTRNFAAGLPVFATSIAVLDNGWPCVAVIVEHNLGHTYAAVSGRGATLNARQIRLTDPDSDEDYVVGVPSSKDGLTVGIVQAWAETKELICRNLGSTAMHLALVSSGAMAAAFARRSKVWDIAAGWLLVREAGGRITDLRGNELAPFRLDADPEVDIPFLAGAPEMHRRLLRSLPATRARE